MTGISLVLDLLRSSGGGGAGHAQHLLQSSGLFSAAIAASAAAASVAGTPIPFPLFGDGRIPIAYCDAATEWSPEYVLDLDTASSHISQADFLKYRIKEYPVEPKPLFSAFAPKTLAVTSLRSFLLFYLPLLEPQPHSEDDDDFDAPEEKHVDLKTPFEKSLKQIARETTVVTTRRVLERLAIHYVSQRMAWKLLKDVPKSAKRKAERGMPAGHFIYSVSRTTFRGHLLGVAASWIVQIGIEVYRCFFRKTSDNTDDEDDVPIAEKVSLLGRKIYSTTIKCGASLIFASVGAGLFALAHPSIGQWIGCAIGDFAGPVIAVIVLEKLHLES